MKNVTRIFLSYITAIIFLLSGCEKSDSTYQTEDAIQVQVGEELMEAIMDKDIEGVKSLLCPYFIENHEDLDEEIQGIFDFIKGDVISYENVWSCGYAGHIENGKWIEKFSLADIQDIATTSDTYEIHFQYYFVNEDEPKMLGISYINVILCEDIGEYSDPIVQYIISAEPLTD